MLLKSNDAPSEDDPISLAFTVEDELELEELEEVVVADSVLPLLSTPVVG